MVRWLRWHCPPDTGFEIRALAVWGRARYLSVTEAPHNTNFHTWMGKKQFCFFQTAEAGNRTPDSGVKGSGANHYPRAPAHKSLQTHVDVTSTLKINWHFAGGATWSCHVSDSVAVNNIRLNNAGLRLGWRRRRQTSINTALFKRVVFTGYSYDASIPLPPIKFSSAFYKSQQI